MADRNSKRVFNYCILCYRSCIDLVVATFKDFIENAFDGGYRGLEGVRCLCNNANGTDLNCEVKLVGYLM